LQESLKKTFEKLTLEEEAFSKKSLCEKTEGGALFTYDFQESGRDKKLEKKQKGTISCKTLLQGKKFKTLARK